MRLPPDWLPFVGQPRCIRAAYACWAVHLRTPQLDVGVIAIRRKFIPPIGDTYQDIFVILHDDVAIDDPAIFMAGLERQADTLSPLVRRHADRHASLRPSHLIVAGLRRVGDRYECPFMTTPSLA